MTNEYGYNANGKPPASGAPQSPAGYQSAQGASSGTGFGQPQGTGSSGYQAYQQATAATASTGFAAASAGAGGSGSPTGGPSGAHGSGKKPGGARTFLLGFAGAALACVLALGGFALWQGAAGPSGSTVIGGAGSSVNASDEDATLAEAVAEKALPSVAAIDVYTEDSGMYGMYGYGAGSGELTETSLGSGVVISEDGYIITNNHVVEGADALRVTIDGQEYDAEIVGTDPSSDLAVVKAEGASGLTAIELGDSDNLTIGEWVMSIGSPFGLEQSVATGIVSATNRSQIMDSSSDAYGQGETTVYTNMIQTDAAINPGNSGGALVDMNGHVVGINSSKIAAVDYEGLGFAIPSDTVQPVVSDLIEYGYVKDRPMLGITGSYIDRLSAGFYGLSQGYYVAEVVTDNAKASGLQQYDVITAIDDTQVTSASTISNYIANKKPGDTVTLTVDRALAGEEGLKIDLVLSENSGSSN